MEFEHTDFLGMSCVRLKNSAISVLVTESCGPRIAWFSLWGAENILAELPDETIEHPGGEQPFQLRGGHRLWYAPENPEITYMPDDDPVQITPLKNKNGVNVLQKVEPNTFIEKGLQVVLPSDKAVVVIEHRLTNRGSEPRRLAPWAITQLKPQGFAILPQASQDIDPYGVLPNRALNLWPYTNLSGEHVQFDTGYLFIKAIMEEGALKVGWANTPGWMAYWRAGMLFVKQSSFVPEASYPDLGSSAECYCNPDFLELESLGPWVMLQPGETVRHVERWSLHRVSVLHPEAASVDEAIARLRTA